MGPRKKNPLRGLPKRGLRYGLEESLVHGLNLKGFLRGKSVSRGLSTPLCVIFFSFDLFFNAACLVTQSQKAESFKLVLKGALSLVKLSARFKDLS